MFNSNSTVYCCERRVTRVDQHNSGQLLKLSRLELFLQAGGEEAEGIPRIFLCPRGGNEQIPTIYSVFSQEESEEPEIAFSARNGALQLLKSLDELFHSAPRIVRADSINS